MTKIVSGSSDKTVCVYDMILEKLLHSIPFHTKFVYSVKFSPDINNIVYGYGNKKVHIFDTNTGKLLYGLSDNVIYLCNWLNILKKLLLI